jgi:hypothetical protein
MTQVYVGSHVSTHLTLLKFGILGLQYKLSSRVTVFTQLQAEVFPLNMALKYVMSS